MADAGWAGQALGTERYKADPYKIDPKAYVDPKSDEERGNLRQLTAVAENRQAPQATAAQRTALATYGGATITGNERNMNTNLGPASQGTATRGTAVNGTAFNGSAAKIDRSDDEFRWGQKALVKQLQDQADGNGPSLATMQMNQGTERNVAQQMGAAAAMGGNSALAKRNVANTTAAANRSTVIDSAQARIQEQLNARAQLAGVLESARGQDIGVNTAQAGMQQQTNLANQSAANTQGLANQSAENTQGLANMQAGNQFGLANMDARNQFALQQGQMNQQNGQFNAGQTNALNLSQAQLLQQAGLANMGATNEMYTQNTANEQQTNLANVQAQLQQMGLNDDQVRSLLGMRLAQNEADRQAQMTQQQLATQQAMGTNNTNAQSANAQADRGANFIGAIGNAVGTVGTTIGKIISDPASKEDIKEMSEDKGSGDDKKAVKPKVDWNETASGIGKGFQETMSRHGPQMQVNDPYGSGIGAARSSFGQYLSQFAQPTRSR